MKEPAQARPAATLVVLRDGPDGGGPEIFLVKRHGKSGFMPNAYVFPGGRVDDHDGDEYWPRSAGRTAAHRTSCRAGV